VSTPAERFIEEGLQAEAKGRWRDACELYRKAAIEAPGLAKAHLNLGAALEALGDVDAAIVAYEAALAAEAGNPYAAYNLGRMRYLRGALPAAEELLARALAAKPGFTEARVMLASVYRSQGRLAEAAAALETSLQERPDDGNARYWFGNALAELNRTAEAVEQYRCAIALQPDHAAAWSNLGHLQIGAGARDEARTSFERAVRLEPGLAEAQLNLGHILKDQGERDAALACYRAALAARPDYAEARWSAAMCRVPVHVEAGEDLERTRAQFAAELEDLAQWFQGVGAAEGAKAVGVQQPFWLAYQERDNRPLLERYGRLCANLMGRWQDEQGIRAAPPPSHGPIRVAVVSQYFRDHSVWNAIIKGWFGQIDPARFRLFAFCLGGEEDGETAYARRHAARFERGPRSLRQWADAIVAAQPDVVLYPELGMDPMSIKLAGLRLAPVQATSWGHPETSGLPTIDYYLSAEMLEPPNAQAHYSERLVELPALGCYVERSAGPAIAPRLADWNLGADDALLLCPGVPFKYAPQNDAILAEIARRVPRGKLVFFTHSVSALTDKLRERLRAAFTRAGLDLDAHAVFVPWQARAAFHGWLGTASVFLDTVGFSGFNTALQAAERGLPVVTRAGRFMRGRLAAGIAERMGLQELVARSDEDYVALAVRLATEQGYAQSVRSRIAASSGHLFFDAAPVRALETFLAQATRGAPPGGQPSA
jgi:protein O-GlcNAc transferase